jgi:hypothetical protein
MNKAKALYLEIEKAVGETGAFKIIFNDSLKQKGDFDN